MTGVQIFLMGFGAVLAVIGVIVFFLLAWFKETTGQEHHNAIKILQAEFRFSNPALVIFAGGLLLMVSPLFLDQAARNNPPPAPPANSSAAGGDRVDAGLSSPGPGAGATAPAPPPTRTPTPTREVPTETPEPAADVPDAAGRWRAEDGYLEVRSRGEGSLSFTAYDRAGNQVGQGSGWQVDEFVYLDGQGLIFDWLGNPIVVEYSADFELDGDTMMGDIFDGFGNYLGTATYIRD
jgi:hypothetical protein